MASVYGIVIGLFVHRELKLEKLWAIFRDNAAFIAGTMFVMAPSKATGQVFAYLNITKIIANFMFSISTNPYIVLCMIFVIMFIVGMFVQTTPPSSFWPPPCWLSSVRSASTPSTSASS